MFNQFMTTILTVTSDLFGGEGAPWIVGATAIGVIGLAMTLGPALYWATRPDKNAKLAEALRLGNIGEHLGNEDEEVEVNNPAPADSMPEIPRIQPTLRQHLPRRQVVRWLDNNTVQATTRHRRHFYGVVVGRKRGELILQREKGCPIRVRQPQ